MTSISNVRIYMKAVQLISKCDLFPCRIWTLLSPFQMQYCAVNIWAGNVLRSLESCANVSTMRLRLVDFFFRVRNVSGNYCFLTSTAAVALWETLLGNWARDRSFAYLVSQSIHVSQACFRPASLPVVAGNRNSSLNRVFAFSLTSTLFRKWHFFSRQLKTPSMQRQDGTMEFYIIIGFIRQREMKFATTTYRFLWWACRAEFGHSVASPLYVPPYTTRCHRWTRSERTWPWRTDVRNLCPRSWSLRPIERHRIGWHCSISRSYLQDIPHLEHPERIVVFLVAQAGVINKRMVNWSPLPRAFVSHRFALCRLKLSMRDSQEFWASFTPREFFSLVRCFKAVQSENPCCFEPNIIHFPLKTEIACKRRGGWLFRS